VYRKLDSAISMMKAIEDRSRDNGTEAFDLAMERGIFVQRTMGPRFIVVSCVPTNDPTQMSLAEDDHVVETFPPDCTDQSLRIRVLPRRAGGNRLVTNTHRAYSVGDGSPMDSIPVVDQVARSLPPRECFRYLACDPLGARVRGDVDPDKISPFQPDDDEDIEQVEADGGNNEQVHGGDIRCMVE
jgi:hypothetical protein